MLIKCIRVMKTERSELASPPATRAAIGGVCGVQPDIVAVVGVARS